MRWIPGFCCAGGQQWLPYGTLAANMIACVALFAIVRHGQAWASAGLVPAWAPRALAVGFLGSLSTVSTFAMEVRAIMSQHPEHGNRRMNE